jgi:hypothetical protein
MEDLIKKRDEEIYESQKRMCMICADEVHIEKFCTLDCGHKFCWECMEGFIDNKLDELKIKEDDIICLDPGCDQEISPFQIEASVSKDTYAKLVHFRTKYLNGIKSCPSTKGCENQFFVDENQ